jgi:hypothetical protein
MPPGRTLRRPGQSPQDPSNAVGPQPEEFDDQSGRMASPPVIRAPQRDRTGQPPVTRSGVGDPAAAVPPPGGTTPPVINRSRPYSPESERRRPPVRAGFGTNNDFAPPAPPGGPVIERESAEAAQERAGDLVAAAQAAGVLRRTEPTASDGRDLGARKEAPARTALDDEIDALTALFVSGEAAWSVPTPGGGVVGSPPERVAQTSAGPKPQLRGGTG